MAQYTTVETVRAALNMTATNQDLPISIAIAAASKLINSHCGRSFALAATSTSRVYAAESREFCAIDDVASATGLAVYTRASVASDWTLIDATAIQLEPLNGLRNGVEFPYTAVRAVFGNGFPLVRRAALVKVTAAFGWAELPAEIEQACLIQAIRLFKRPESAMGVMGVSDVGVLTISRGLDTDVALLLNDYVRSDGI